MTQPLDTRARSPPQRRRAPGRSRRRARSSSGWRRLPGGAGKPVIFETGYGPSGLPHIGTFGEVARTAMVRHAFEVLTEGRHKTRLVCFSDDMDGLQEGARQRAQQGHAGGAPRQAAVVRARSLQQRVSELCRAQQRAPAPLPRPLRLRVRVPVRHRVLQGRQVRRHAAEDARGLRRGDGHHPADAGARAPRHLLAVPADLARAPARCCRCRWSSATRSKGTVVYVDPDTGQEGRDARHRRPRQVRSGRPTGRCAGPRSASTTRCAART